MRRHLFVLALAALGTGLLGGCPGGVDVDAGVGEGEGEGEPDAGPLPQVRIAAPVGDVVTNDDTVSLVIEVLGPADLVEILVGEEVDGETFDGIYILSVAAFDEGTYDVRVRATNDAGAVTTSPIQVTVDRTPPAIVARAPAQDGALGLDNAITYELSEPPDLVSGEVLASDDLGTSYSTFTSYEGLVATVTLSPTPPADARVTITVSGATDRAGNTMADDSWSFDAPFLFEVAAPQADDMRSFEDREIALDSAGRPFFVVVRGSRISDLGDVSAYRWLDGAWSDAASLGTATPWDGADLQLTTMLGAPLAAFPGTDDAQLRLWDDATSTWTTLPGPGAGTAQVALAAAGDDPYLAWIESGAARVRRLIDMSWIDHGAPVASSVTDLQLAPSSSGGVLLATVSGGQVQLWDDGGTAGFTALGPPLDVTSTSRPQLAQTPSGAVLVTLDNDATWELASGAWRRLPDLAFRVASNARGRRVAVDDTRVLAVLTERPLFQAHERGYVFRFDGDEWRPYGPSLFDGTSDTSLARVAAGPGGVLVTWEDATGTRARFLRGHTASTPPPALTGATTVTGCLTTPPVDFSSLADTGCFVDVPGRVPAPGVLPYDVQTALWTDGAAKRRWIALPPGGTIDWSATGAWGLPAGTVLIKDFAIEERAGDRTTIRPVETRFLVVDEVFTWARYSYQWNAEGTEAFLREATPADPIVTFDVYDENGDPDTRDHFFPTRDACSRCHQSVATTLGLETSQMNRPFDYGAGVDNQLRALARAGVFGTSFDESLLGDAHRMPNETDTTWDITSRLRSFQQANCSHCHKPLFDLNLKWEVPTYAASGDDSGLCGKIAKGDLDGSKLWWRDVQWEQFQNPGQPGPMPPLGLLVQYPAIAELVEGFILADDNPCP
jgi:hypothetical protein